MKTNKKFIIFAVLIVAALAFITYRNMNLKPQIGSAALSWNANAEADLSGYRIYYGTEPRSGDCPEGGYAKNIDVKNVIRYTLDNLGSGKTYYFSVTSYNTAGKESCFSEEMKKTISGSKFGRIKDVFKWLVRG